MSNKNSTREQSLAELEATIRNLTNNVFAAMLMVKKISEADDVRWQQAEASLSELSGNVTKIEEKIRLMSRHLGI